MTGIQGEIEGECYLCINGEAFHMSVRSRSRMRMKIGWDLVGFRWGNGGDFKETDWNSSEPFIHDACENDVNSVMIHLLVVALLIL